LQAICYEAWRAEEREILFANVSSWYIGCGGDGVWWGGVWWGRSSLISLFMIYNS